MAMPTSPIPVSPELLAITGGFRNLRYVADRILPRLAPIKKTLFEYVSYRKGDNFSIPNTAVGRTGRPNTVLFGSKKEKGGTEWESLETPIPKEDMDIAAAEGRNIRGKRTAQLTNLLMLQREQKVAKMVMDPAIYGANVLALAAADRFDTTTANPLKLFSQIMDGMVVRPNKAAFGREAWTAFSMCPSVVKAALGNNGDSGVAPVARICELLGLDEIIIGEARLNTAGIGQTPKLDRVWPAAVCLFYQEANADTEDGMTFGYTVQTGERSAGEIYDPHCGPEGGLIVRTWERRCELITCTDAGFYISRVIGV